jgi:hypothetical protein
VTLEPVELAPGSLVTRQRRPGRDDPALGDVVEQSDAHRDCLLRRDRQRHVAPRVGRFDGSLYLYSRLLYFRCRSHAPPESCSVTPPVPLSDV